MHREHCDQTHDLHADALGLRVIRAGGARLRPWEVADRDVGDLLAANRRELYRGIGKAELSETRARIDGKRLPDLSLAALAFAQGTYHLHARRLACAPQHHIHSADNRRLPGSL